MSDHADLRPKHDWAKIVATVIAVGGVIYAAAQNLISLGETKATINKVERIEAKVSSQGEDITAIRYEAKSANAAAQRVEAKVDEGFKDINNTLRRIRITGR